MPLVEYSTEAVSDVDTEDVSAYADALPPRVSLLSVDVDTEVTGTISRSETVGDDGDRARSTCAFIHGCACPVLCDEDSPCDSDCRSRNC
jgi:hypothetical protein